VSKCIEDAKVEITRRILPKVNDLLRIINRMVACPDDVKQGLGELIDELQNAL